MPETTAKDTARQNLRKLAIFAHTAGMGELECRAIIAQVYREQEAAQETPEQAAVRESLEAQEPVWPAKCYKPNSCGRNRMCVYALRVDQCPHVVRNIGPEIDAENARRVRGASADFAQADEVRAPDGTVLKSRALCELAARENVVPLHIVTEDGTRLERNTGRPVVGSFHNGE